MVISGVDVRDSVSRLCLRPNRGTNKTGKMKMRRATVGYDRVRVTRLVGGILGKTRETRDKSREKRKCS